jgi:hypothetical protein
MILNTISKSGINLLQYESNSNTDTTPLYSDNSGTNLNPTNRLIHRPWWLDQFHYNPFKHLIRIIQYTLDLESIPPPLTIYLKYNLITTTQHSTTIKSILRYQHNQTSILAHPDIELWLIQHKHLIRVDRCSYYKYIHILFKSEELLALYILSFPTLNRLPPSQNH